MLLEDGVTPSARAAETVLATMDAGIRRRLEQKPKGGNRNSEKSSVDTNN
ncbi:MAG: hypothetical protein P8Y47_09205 [Alphaproteobacteria bacterium]